MNDDDFYTRLRDARDRVKLEDQRQTDIIQNWDDLLNRYAEDYKVFRDNAKMEKLDTDQSKQALRDFVYQSGIQDGKWEDENYDDLEFQEYGTNLLNNIFDNATTFDKYIEQYGSEDQKATYAKNKKRAEASDIDKKNRGLSGLLAADLAAKGYMLGGPLMGMGETGALGILGLASTSKQKDLENFYNKYVEETNNKLNTGFDMIVNSQNYLDKANALPNTDKTTVKTSSSNSSAAAAPAGSGFSDDESEGDIIEYTYKPGDTFGQVLVDLGLATDKGLWGKGGDVEFYDKQLWSQGAPDPVTGFIPIGTKIKLRKRK